MIVPWIGMLILCAASIVRADRPLFKTWFPGFKDYFEDEIQNSCHQEYEAYLYNATCVTCSPILGQSLRGVDVLDALAVNVVSCLLANAEEFVKANLAVGTVILGLLPTILSFSGSSTSEFGLLVLKRPLLATILALSAPSIFPLRALEFETDPTAALKAGQVPFEFPSKPPKGIWLHCLSVLEYAFALAAAANMGTQIWTLCANSLSALGPTLRFFPLIWPLTSLFVYLVGALQLSLRLQLVSGPIPLKQRVANEFSLCASHARPSPTLRSHSKLLATLASWLVSFFTVCNIVYGTVAFSSQLFISTADAANIAIRLLASAVVSRFILMYEISGISHSLGVRAQQ